MTAEKPQPSAQDQLNPPKEVTDITHILDAMKASDMQIIDVRELCDFTDWMIIVSGRSARHVVATAEALALDYKRQHKNSPSMEGTESGEWVLIDCMDVIVHIMLPETRDLYALEKLWSVIPAQRMTETKA